VFWNSIGVRGTSPSPGTANTGGSCSIAYFARGGRMIALMPIFTYEDIGKCNRIHFKKLT
jgi:hypothetical protein